MSEGDAGAQPDAEPDAQPDADALVDRARMTQIVVVGGGIGGLVAALECAKLGMPVMVLEAADAVGGAVRTAEVAGLRLDVGAESFATRGGHVRALIDELGLGAEVVRPRGGRAWIAGFSGPASAAPIPTGGVLGIPDNPWAAEVRRIIGWRGAWRAYLDRLRPPLTIGHQHSLGVLVRTRMGRRVLDRLVTPVVSGVYSARPDDIDVDVAAPGLNAALTRVGSLAGAAAIVRGDRRSAPGAAVEGIRGGMSRLAAALVERIEELGGEIRVDTPVERIRRDGAGWSVEIAQRPEDAAVHADALIVATDERTARTLLAETVPELAQIPSETPPRVDIVTLVLDSSRLDAAPRGTGVLTVPGAFRAKALTHATAKWAWLAEAAAAQAPHRHVVRVSFGAQGEPPVTDGLTDAEVYTLAVAEASALLGVTIEPGALVGAHVARFTQSQPASMVGQADRALAARAAAHRVPGLGVAGAWLAGTGLAQVVPDAQAEAEHVRRGALWGPDAMV